MRTLKPSNIACIAILTTDGEEERYVYLTEDKVEADVVYKEGKLVPSTPFDNLDKKARDAINAHFTKLFSVPIEERGQAVKDCKEVEV